MDKSLSAAHKHQYEMDSKLPQKLRFIKQQKHKQVI